MFDTLIREAADRFGLGTKARPFVALLLDLLFDSGSGGVAGLRQRFQQHGLGDLFGSWIGGQPGDNALQPDQFAAALGEDQVHAMANRLDIPAAAASLAGAALLPRLVALVTPNGHIPTAPPPAAADLLAAPTGTATARPAASPYTAHPAAEPPRRGGWMKWLIPLAIILLALMLMRRCGQQLETPPPADPVTAPATTDTTPVTQTDPRFHLEQRDGAVTVSGQLASEAERTRLWDALVGAYGANRVQGQIDVDAATAPASWLDRLVAGLPELKNDGLTLDIHGERIALDTQGMADEQRFALSDRVRQNFTGFEITGLWDRAAAALAGLKAGFSGDDLVTALNLMNIYFDTGSATITRDSQETLAAAAKAIAAAPAGTRIEVGGHTDNTGDAAANQTLSEQRAQAVVARLGELGVGSAQLTAKGHGQTTPRADNDTEEGRAQNRRIEFTVLK